MEQKKLYARTPRHFEGLLIVEHFIRVHRGFLINSSFIINYDKDENILRLENVSGSQYFTVEAGLFGGVLLKFSLTI